MRLEATVFFILGLIGQSMSYNCSTEAARLAEECTADSAVEGQENCYQMVAPVCRTTTEAEMASDESLCRKALEGCAGVDRPLSGSTCAQIAEAVEPDCSTHVWVVASRLQNDCDYAVTNCAEHRRFGTFDCPAQQTALAAQCQADEAITEKKPCNKLDDCFAAGRWKLTNDSCRAAFYECAGVSSAPGLPASPFLPFILLALSALVFKF